MIDWVIDKDGEEKVTFYSCTAHRGELEKGIDVLWKKFATNVLQENSEFNWDVIRVELWLDSGRVIVFPALEPLKERAEISGCQIHSKDLIEFYDCLADSDLTDDEFESKIEQKEIEIINQLSDKLENYTDRLIGRRVLFWSANSGSVLRERVI